MKRTSETQGNITKKSYSCYDSPRVEEKGFEAKKVTEDIMNENFQRLSKHLTTDSRS